MFVRFILLARLWNRWIVSRCSSSSSVEWQLITSFVTIGTFLLNLDKLNRAKSARLDGNILYWKLSIGFPIGLMPFRWIAVDSFQVTGSNEMRWASQVADHVKDDAVTGSRTILAGEFFMRQRWHSFCVSPPWQLEMMVRSEPCVTILRINERLNSCLAFLLSCASSLDRNNQPARQKMKTQAQPTHSLALPSFNCRYALD